MSTRSVIGKLNDDGKVRWIYCHHDGYPEGVGDTLIKCYNTPESIEALLDLGDLSSLCETLESCVAYGRDRGETGTEAQTLDKGELLNEIAWESYWAEYAYIFEGGAWVVYDWSNKTEALGNVAEVLARREEEAEEETF